MRGDYAWRRPVGNDECRRQAREPGSTEATSGRGGQLCGGYQALVRIGREDKGLVDIDADDLAEDAYPKVLPRQEIGTRTQ